MNTSGKNLRNLGLGSLCASLLFLAACSTTGSGSAGPDSADPGRTASDADVHISSRTSTDGVDIVASSGSGDFPPAPQLSEADMPLPDSSLGMPEARPVVPTPLVRSRENVTSPRENAFGIQLARGDDFEQVVLSFPEAEVPPYELMRLEDPARVVVDIKGLRSDLNQVYPVESSAYLSQIRLGTHPDKVRLVLDVRDASAGHQVTQVGKDVFITLGKQGRVDQIASVLTTSPSSSAGTYSESQVFAGEAVAGDGTLQHLRLENIPGSGPAVVAELSSSRLFRLQRTAPSEYVLRLENTGFDPHGVQAVVSSETGQDIRSARPIQEGGDTLVRIFANPTVDLYAETEKNKIVVKSRSVLAGLQGAKDVRAQLAPDEAAAGGGDAEEDGVAEFKLGEDVLSRAEVAGAGKTSDRDIESALSSLLDDAPKYTGRLISLDLQDTDIDNALRIIAEVSNLNIIASDDVSGKVTLRLIDVPWDQALDVILKTKGLDKVQEGNVVRIAPVEKLRTEREALKQAIDAEEDLEPLQVKYLRVSYARAAELKDLVENVISERGVVSYDERTNQLIVKDIKRGIVNVAELVKKLDLRTPQVLLETQIVEAQRTLFRELGSELGFTSVQSPATGNATGYNFPNSVVVGGGIQGGAPGLASAFPAAVTAGSGSAVSILLDSADGAFGLDARLSALEREGRVRIVSKPSVATTNNTQATIKAVEKLRIMLPDGGLSVATGAGATAAGTGGQATEIVEIGIILDVTPQASPDYYVLLDINAKSSTLGTLIIEGIPSEVERSATSTVLVSSGQTFAMGGIYKITDQSRVNGVPFLKDIPFLGHLFRYSQVDNSDEELIFFITPRIIEGSFDDAAMSFTS